MKELSSQIRKAAILIASLDRATAQALLAKMPRQQATEILEIVEILGEVERSEEEDVIDEFFRIGPLLPEDQPAGIELDSRLAEQIGNASNNHPSTSNHRLQKECDVPAPFRFLHGTEGASLARRLQNEHPQTIAVVVSHLPPQNGAALLAHLPASLQAQVAKRLVELEETEPEVLSEIENGLASWLQDHQRSLHRRSAGMMALQGILAAADPLAQHALISNLSRYDQRLAKQLASQEGHGYTFEDLHQLDDASLEKLFNHADHEVIKLALAGAGKAMVARAFKVLPVARAARLRRDLDQPIATRIRDIERAQQDLANLASDMDYDGQLSKKTGRKLSLAI